MALVTSKTYTESKLVRPAWELKMDTYSSICWSVPPCLSCQMSVSLRARSESWHGCDWIIRIQSGTSCAASIFYFRDSPSAASHNTTNMLLSAAAGTRGWRSSLWLCHRHMLPSRGPRPLGLRCDKRHRKHNGLRKKGTSGQMRRRFIFNKALTAKHSPLLTLFPKWLTMLFSEYFIYRGKIITFSTHRLISAHMFTIFTFSVLWFVWSSSSVDKEMALCVFSTVKQGVTSNRCRWIISTLWTGKRKKEERLEVGQSVTYKREVRRPEFAVPMVGTYLGRVANDRCCVDSEAPQSHL